ncbi:MAG: TldD/PmbA family protein, partial [Allobaculum sp.]|nr:TldD/PmbA family protein [Allobaculum sp.]
MDKQKWIDRALELGMDGFEITQSHQRSREVEWFEGTMDSFSTSKIISTSMRALIDGKIVSTALEKVEDNKMDETLNGLKEAALLISESEKDELVPPMETDMVQSKWKWIEPAVPQILDTLQSLEKKLLAADSRVTMVNSLGFTSGFGQSQMNNSLGVDIQESSGIQALFAQITMQDDGDLRDGYVYEIVENLDDLDQDALVQKLIDKVAFQLHAKSLKAQVCPVIINYEAMSTLLSAFAPMFSGSLIEKGISPLSHS